MLHSCTVYFVGIIRVGHTCKLALARSPGQVSKLSLARLASTIFVAWKLLKLQYKHSFYFPFCEENAYM